MMNILMLSYQGDMGGQTRLMAFLSKGLAARGHRVFFGCRKESKIYSQLQDSQVRSVPMEFSRWGGKATGEIVKLCRAENIDLINSHSSQDRYAAIRARYFHGVKAKIVFTRHQPPNSSRLSCLLGSVATHKVIAVSRAVADGLAERWLSRSKLVVVYNGLPPEKLVAADESEVKKLRDRLGIPEGTPVVGCIARKKNQEVLLKACQFLPPEVVILIVGPGEQPEWRKLIETLNLPQRIMLLPYDYNSTPYFGLLTVSVLATSSEGLSYTALESMALGVPVVASRNSGNPELIEDNWNGMLYSNDEPAELAAKIKQLLADSGLAGLMVERSRERVLREFTIENTIVATEAVFEVVLKE